jgi:hypothetical protein
MFGEAFGFEAFGRQIGDRVARPVVDHQILSILLIYAAGQGRGARLAGLLWFLVFFFLWRSLLRLGIGGRRARKSCGGDQCE